MRTILLFIFQVIRKVKYTFSDETLKVLLKLDTQEFCACIFCVSWSLLLRANYVTLIRMKSGRKSCANKLEIHLAKHSVYGGIRASLLRT